MKILVITRNAWDDSNAIGNTLSNFFSGIDDIEFANIYFRSASPNNKMCKEYYRVTEFEILKRWFSPKKIGSHFTYTCSCDSAVRTTIQKRDKKIVQFVRSHNVKLAYWLSNCIWYSRRWQNENLANFIRSFAPDLVVTFVKSSPQYYLTVKYLRDYFKIPVLSWIADDEYTEFLQNGSLKEINNLKYILNESTIVKGCSKKICDYYNSVFDCEATPLYKGCDLSTDVKGYINKPLKIVYAGNLLYGRIEIIRDMAQILDYYDPTGESVKFEIYSNTSLSSEDEKYFAERCCTKYLGCLDYDIIKKKLTEADVVLHVESFERDYILKTKYSFSTKIIDCLQSGNAMLAIGPAEIASIDYIKQIPGAYVIDCQNNLEAKLIDFLDDRASFSQRSVSIREFAKKNHDGTSNAQLLRDILNSIK